MQGMGEKPQRKSFITFDEELVDQEEKQGQAKVD